MKDKNDPDKKIEGADSTQDQEIIELQEETFVASQDDEEIIDLLEAVDELAVEDIQESVVTEEATSAEEIITVTETMSDPPQEIEEIGEPIHITDDTSQEAEDLTDLEEDLLEEPSGLDDEFGKEVAFDQGLSDDFVDSLGMELDAKEDVSEDLLDTEKVSDAQMEAALERVIKKMFYEKIDGILVEVIEKTVTRELERLKSILLKDAEGNEK
ncbi:MAG: hypothetical protein U9N83_02870 [Thermodesulfobacteriota bacterium]|nr:hypothetical protein [Thermodesulfobacteriota bacterium]